MFIQLNLSHDICSLIQLYRIHRRFEEMTVVLNIVVFSIAGKVRKCVISIKKNMKGFFC